LILLDTNVVIHYLKGDPAIVAHMRRTSRTDMAIPAIVVYELEYGTLRAKLHPGRRRDLEVGLEQIQHVPFDTAAANRAASIRFELERQGLTIGPLDILIAGTAVSLGATLVTNNATEFSRIPGLRVLDWKSAGPAIPKPR
jgi:tRNA(fMet)-specific endonuclease VapC